MTTAVRAMVSKCLGALIYQNVDLATQVLESDDVVDQYRDRIFEALLSSTTADPAIRPGRISISFLLRGTSNALPTTPRISPRTFCSGCAALKYATDAPGSKLKPSEAQSDGQRVVTEFSHCTHRKFKRRGYTLPHYRLRIGGNLSGDEFNATAEIES